MQSSPQAREIDQFLKKLQEPIQIKYKIDRLRVQFMQSLKRTNPGYIEKNQINIYKYVDKKYDKHMVVAKSFEFSTESFSAFKNELDMYLQIQYSKGSCPFLAKFQGYIHGKHRFHPYACSMPKSQKSK